jgi:putative NADH-flavin reductase
MGKKIAVVGASKGIGLAVVKQALAEGHSVTALARTPAQLVDERLVWVAGQAQDENVLQKALEGAEAVVTTLGVTGNSETRVFSEAAKAVISVMRAKGIDRLVAVTGFGTGDGRGRGGFLYDKVIFPMMLSKTYADKDREEALIRSSPLQWTILRPGRLTNGPATDKVRVLADPRKYVFAPISRADVARFVLETIEAAKLVKQSPVIVGPQ